MKNNDTKKRSDKNDFGERVWNRMRSLERMNIGETMNDGERREKKTYRKCHIER